MTPVRRFVVDPNIRVLFGELGINARTVLRRANLPADLLAHTPTTLATDEYYRLWDAIEQESSAESLAVGIGQSISVEMFAPSLFAALCSPNLCTAATRIATYKPLIGPLDIVVTTPSDGLSIECHWPVGHEAPAILVNIELVFWVALARIATRHNVQPVRITSPHPDGAIAEFSGCDVVRGDTAAITFSATDAGRPFLTENETMWRFFAPELRRRLADLDAAATAVERVQAALVEILPAGDSTISAVTNQLAVSQRTLQRQLQQEGTSYQAVLAQTRERLARHYLTASTMSTPEIAYLLGYDETSSFYRAFRLWTNTTPDDVRSTTART